MIRPPFPAGCVFKNNVPLNTRIVCLFNDRVTRRGETVTTENLLAVAAGHEGLHWLRQRAFGKLKFVFDPAKKGGAFTWTAVGPFGEFTKQEHARRHAPVVQTVSDNGGVVFFVLRNAQNATLFRRITAPSTRSCSRAL